MIRFTPTIPTVFAALLLCTPATGVVVDDFQTGTFHAPDGVLIGSLIGFEGVSHEQFGLDPEHVITGARRAWVRLVTGTTASLEINPSGTADLVFSVAPNSSGAIQIGYGDDFGGLALDADFYAGGQVGFEAIFTEAPAEGWFYIAINTRNGGQYFTPNIEIKGPRTYRFPYSNIINEFGVDAVDMDLASGIFWGIWNVPESFAGSRYVISEIRTYVPEPATAGLSGGAILCLGALSGRFAVARRKIELA